MPVPRHGIVLVPIFDCNPQPLEAFTLRWGIANGHTRVTEVDDGHVDRVRVEHTGATLILVLDGEEVLGAKQNRMFNASFLVPPHHPTVLPVSCVERGRWRHESAAFSSASRTVVTSVRKAKLQRIARGTGVYDAGQREVWKDVDTYLERTQIVSRTSAYADAANTRMQDIDASLDDIALERGQVGFAAVTARGDVTLDVFGSPGLFNRAWRTVGRGLLADDVDGVTPAESEAAVGDLLSQLQAIEPRTQSAPGIGQSMFATAGETAASAIAHEGRVYHLVAMARRTA